MIKEFMQGAVKWTVEIDNNRMDDAYAFLKDHQYTYKMKIEMKIWLIKHFIMKLFILS